MTKKRGHKKQRHAAIHHSAQTLDRDFQKWFDVCNKTGLTCLLVALACVPLHAHAFWATVGFVAVTLGQVYQFDKMPPAMQRLRKLAKTDPVAKQELRDMLSHYMGLRPLLTRNGLFLLGYMVLILIVLSEIITHDHPFMQPIVEKLLS
jgi:hypothetical protein